MILCDSTIRELIDKNVIGFQPLIPENIQPASIDVTLSNIFLEPRFSKFVTELDEPMKYDEYVANAYNGYVIRPNSFVLASTEEYMCIPNNLTAWIEGRSSIGRIGLFIQNAGWIDPGFEGTITLELYNASKCSIRLKPGDKVGQIIFAELDKPCDNPYRGKYQKQNTTTGSKIYEDYKK